MPSYKPLTVALMNDYEIVVRGLARMLEPFSDRIEVVELAIAAPSTTPVDVALYDTFAADKVFGREVQAERFVMYSVETSDHFVSAARANGADGVLSKSLSPEQLVEALERIHAGEFLVLTGSEDNESNGDWPARSLGLSEREAEIVSLITLGLGNEDIADRLFLSINTVKSYIRTAYRKMGVTSRSKAVLWGVDHGFRKTAPAWVRTSQDRL
jgi:DNA-binding NarL/FixJ family response regulator